MVDAESVAEDTPQALHHLHREGYLWQQIQHLLAFVDGFLYQVDIDFGLPAGGDAMQEHHPLLHPLEEYLVIGILLDAIQRLGILRMGRSAIVQPPHFALERGQHAAVDERTQRCRRSMRDVLQLLACHRGTRLHQTLHHLQLLRCTLEHLAQHLPAALRLIGLRQHHARFRLRTIVVFGFQA